MKAYFDNELNILLDLCGDDKDPKLLVNSMNEEIFQPTNTEKEDNIQPISDSSDEGFSLTNEPSDAEKFQLVNGYEELPLINEQIEDSFQPINEPSGEVLRCSNEPKEELRLSPDELREQVAKESENIEATMTDEDYEALIRAYSSGKNAHEIISEKEEKEKEDRRSRILPLDYVNVYEEVLKNKPKTSDPSDALIICLEELGAVDIEYISALCGMEPREVIADLETKNAIYQNPETCGKLFYKGWETADAYISGNLMQKYKKAEKMAKDYPETFNRNLEALKAACPERILSDGIYVTIGSPWIPARYYNDFLVHFLKIRKMSNGVTYDEVLKRWKVNYSTRDINSRFDVIGMSAVEIFEHTLNNTPIRITDKKRINGVDVFVLNKSRTLAGQEKQKQMISEFRDWIFSTEARKKTLEDIYYENYGCITARKFDGGFLRLDGINPEVSLYPHQRSAIARILLTPSCLLSHSVGTGKTYVMIAAGMEMRRIGTSKKNMYVVPNAIIEQWRKDFDYLYPNAKVFVADRRNMSHSKKEDTLVKMRDGDYDAIIISYNSFKSIPVSLKYKKLKLEKTFRELSAQNGAKKYTKILSDLSVQIVELESKIIEERKNKVKNVFFDDLGITSIFVDEAHNFKNISIASDSELLGVTRVSSHIANDMLIKINLLRMQGIKSIVFATGTPITNSLSDLFVMQTFLQPLELKFYGIDTFDSWALMFGEKTENFEMDVDSCGFRIVERFNKFHNLPELANIFSSVADFHIEDDDSLFININRNTIEVPLSTSQREYLKTLSRRTENIRRGAPETTKKFDPTLKASIAVKDNLLKVTSDGRKMALDIRLVDPSAQVTEKDKITACAEKVFEIFNMDPTLTQLIFCDISTPSIKFNVYDALADKLVELGIDRYLIAFIQDGGASAKRRQTIVDALNDGKFRILIGSTPMLGTGVNAQKHLFAVHHLDVPWRPADMIQREGRMIRQGNENNVVEIYRYVTAGSFDAYSWQLLESKQRFISQLLSGSLDVRDGDEIDSLVLQYAEIKALAIGDPRIKERVTVFNELSRLKLLKAHMITRKIEVEADLEAYKHELAMAKDQHRRLEKDYKLYHKNKVAKFPFKELGERIIEECMSDKIREGITEVGEIYGFKVIVSAACCPDYPIFYLIGNYEKSFLLYNDKGTRLTAQEVAKQIDKYLANLTEIITSVSKKIIRLDRNIKQAQDELNDGENIDDKILLYTEKLEKIEEELGVYDD